MRMSYPLRQSYLSVLLIFAIYLYIDHPPHILLKLLHQHSKIFPRVYCRWLVSNIEAAIKLKCVGWCTAPCATGRVYVGTSECMIFCVVLDKNIRNAICSYVFRFFVTGPRDLIRRWTHLHENVQSGCAPGSQSFSLEVKTS